MTVFVRVAGDVRRSAMHIAGGVISPYSSREERVSMKRWMYVHADQVLPEALVKEIRKYATGLLYIPTDLTQTRQRTAIRVRALKEQGFRNCEIARILGITPRRVCGILKGSPSTTETAIS